MKILLPAIAILWPKIALANESGAHTDPVGSVALALVIILIVAKLGGDLAIRLGQPAVLGELIGGIVVGTLSLLGFSGLEWLKTDPYIDMLARIGVLILLFEVGLESTVGQMLKVGFSSLLVATLGVAVPFALGWGVGAWILPEEGPYMHAFLSPGPSLQSSATASASACSSSSRVVSSESPSTGR